MSILDENMDAVLDHDVKVLGELRTGFNLPAVKMLVLDQGEINLGNQDNFLHDAILNPHGAAYRYFDLSATEKGDYQRIFNVLAQEAPGLAGVLFWNIDQIPAIPDKEDLLYLVRFALKGDTAPNPKPFGEDLDFGPMKVVAQCRAVPSPIQPDGVYIVDTSTI